MKSFSDIAVVPEGGVTEVSGQCNEHGDYTVDALWVFGMLKNEKPECPQCADKRRADEEKQEQDELAQRRQRSRENRLRDAGIPLRTLEAGKFEPPTDRAKQHVSTMRDFLENFGQKHEDGSSLILCGKPGTGKSHLACKLGIELMDKDYSVRYVTASKALRYVRASYAKNPDYSEQDAINYFVNVDLLILDELGVKVASENDKALLFEIIDERYQQKLPSIVISNLTIKNLKEAIDERMIDRLKHNGTLLIFDWESYRGAS